MKVLRNIFLHYSRDGASDQFLSYFYPSSIIFFPCLYSFICGTLKMALIFIFLSYRYPCLPTCFLCLSLILMRHYNSDIEYQLELKEFLLKQVNIYSIFYL